MAKTVPTEVTHRFAKRLRATRSGRGYKTARSFAHKLGIHENRYTRYERAEVEPDLGTLMDICTALDVAPNDLLCETIGPGPDNPGPPGTPGFEDEQPASFEAPSPRDLDTSPQTQVKAEAMKLAFELGTILARKDAGGTEPAPMEAIRLGNDLYPTIEADPIAFISSLGSRIDISTADLEAQSRVAAIVYSLVDTLRRKDHAAE